MNKVIIIGNIGQTPELKTLGSGSQVCNFSVATTEKWKDKNTGAMQEKTEWHSIVAWNRQAEIVQQYCPKGTKVAIEGSLETRSWDDPQDGTKRYKTEIKMRQLEILSKKSSNQSTGAAYGSNQQTPPQQEGQQPPPPDDDLPF